jgi:tetratricopeptide (TPR) repeat protein
VPAAWAYRKGAALDAAGRHADAGPWFDRGAVGADRSEVLWRAGRSRLDQWNALPAVDRKTARGNELLGTATARFLEARVASPASAWWAAEIGSVYACRESVARAVRVTDLAALDRGPWSLIGDDGRIAIGLTRAAIQREPNSSEMRDQMVVLLEDNGLHAEALAAMADAARVLPDFNLHPTFSFDALPRDLVETFWRTARSVAPGDAPLLAWERVLLSSGQLGRRLGHLDEAAADLRTALDAPGTPLDLAEVAFHLSLVLIDLSRFDEAEPMLARAAREPAFTQAVAGARARIAEKRERWPEALEQMRIVRGFQPREIGVLLEFAWLAQKARSPGEAEEALKWGVVVHPENPALRRALVDLYVALGQKANARRALDDYILAFGNTGDATRMEQSLAEALDRSPE